jgi:hypothetical protein
MGKFIRLDREDESAQHGFWFGELDRITVVWIVKYLRDTLDFEWLVEAADHFNSVPGRYRVEDQQLAKNVLHMLKLKLIHAADAVFLFMIDAEHLKEWSFRLVKMDYFSLAFIVTSCRYICEKPPTSRGSTSSDVGVLLGDCWLSRKANICRTRSSEEVSIDGSSFIFKARWTSSVWESVNASWKQLTW